MSELILGFTCNFKWPRIAKKKKKENKKIWKTTIWGLTLHNLKTLKSNGTQTMWYFYKGRHVDQWSRLQSPEINLYGQLIFDKDAKTMLWGNKFVLKTNSPEATG